MLRGELEAGFSNIFLVKISRVVMLEVISSSTIQNYSTTITSIFSLIRSFDCGCGVVALPHVPRDKWLQHSDKATLTKGTELQRVAGRRLWIRGRCGIIGCAIGANVTAGIARVITTGITGRIT